MPGWVAIILFKHYKYDTLQNSQTLYKFGFLYQEYTDSAFYWELVKIYEKVLIVIVV